MYTIKLIGNKEGIYINPVNCDACIELEGAVNFEKVSLEGANNVVVYRNQQKEYWISEVGGYTEERGFFCDIYSKDGQRWDDI